MFIKIPVIRISLLSSAGTDHWKIPISAQLGWAGYDGNFAVFRVQSNTRAPTEVRRTCECPRGPAAPGGNLPARGRAPLCTFRTTSRTRTCRSLPGAILGNSHPSRDREFDAEIGRCPERFYCTHMRALKRSDSFGIGTIGAPRRLAVWPQADLLLDRELHRHSDAPDAPYGPVSPSDDPGSDCPSCPNQRR
jgi:hypothetical protein